jgi:hypothetical protein
MWMWMWMWMWKRGGSTEGKVRRLMFRWGMGYLIDIRSRGLFLMLSKPSGRRRVSGAYTTLV